MFKAVDKWLLPYLQQQQQETYDYAGPKELLLCICDHFEPLHGTDPQGALDRIAAWQQGYGALAEEFAAVTGSRLAWTFFYPIEQYEPAIVEALADVCRTSRAAEVEVHLHHDQDTPENLAELLQDGKILLAEEHGLLARDERDQIRFGFVHGNWALNNSHPDGKHCGVVNELQVLLDWGCYADFTFPSAPDPTQPTTINQLYYAIPSDQPDAHDGGQPAAVGTPDTRDKLLIVQGPLALNWDQRKWGVLPRIDNGELTAANPPTADRLKRWTDLGIRVPGRPEWVFVKLHTHGALPENTAALLGEPMRAFARELAEFCTPERAWRVHCVTARELVNIIHAAEDGKDGDPEQYRDYRFRSALGPAAVAPAVLRPRPRPHLIATTPLPDPTIRVIVRVVARPPVIDLD